MSVLGQIAQSSFEISCEVVNLPSLWIGSVLSRPHRFLFRKRRRSSPFTTVCFKVGEVGIFGRLSLLIGKVNQKLVPLGIWFTFDERKEMLFLENEKLTNGFTECV